MKANLRNNLLLSSFLALGVVCIFISYSLVNKYNIDQFLINSDTLYLPSIYLDVFERGNSFFDWSLNGAPNYFPDMFLYFSLYFFSGNLISSMILFSCLQYSIILLLSYKILKPILKDKTVVVIGLSNVILMLLPLGTFFQSDYEITFQFFSNSYHLGAYVNTLLTIYLFQLFLKNNNYKYLVIISLVSAAAVASDQLYAVYFTAPIFVAYIIYGFLSKQFLIKTNYKLLISHIIGLAIGFSINPLLKKYTNISFPESKIQINIESIKNSWDIFISQYSAYLNIFNLNGFLFALVFLCVCILAFIVLKRRDKAQFHYIFIEVFMLSALLAPIVLGVYLGFDSIRYNFAMYILMPFVLAILIYEIVKNKTVLWLLQSVILVIICTLSFINIDDKFYNSENIYAYKNEKIQELNELAFKHNLKNGIATYWDAKKLSMLNNQDVFIANCYENLFTFTHVSNKTWWYIDPNIDGQMLFDFIIIDSDLQKQNTIEMFGNPLQVLQSDNLLIYKYPPFYYPKGDYIPKLLIEG